MVALFSGTDTQTMTLGFLSFYFFKLNLLNKQSVSELCCGFPFPNGSCFGQAQHSKWHWSRHFFLSHIFYNYFSWHEYRPRDSPPSPETKQLTGLLLDMSSVWSKQQQMYKSPGPASLSATRFLELGVANGCQTLFSTPMWSSLFTWRFALQLSVSQWLLRWERWLEMPWPSSYRGPLIGLALSIGCLGGLWCRVSPLQCQNQEGDGRRTN